MGEEGPGRSVMTDAHGSSRKIQTRTTSSEGEQRMRKKDRGVTDKREKSRRKIGKKKDEAEGCVCIPLY